MTEIIDLRSDTMTKPSAAMRQAIAAADVGDDVFDEDPTIHKLQEKVVALTGMQAALFVPSGTMANQLAIRCQTVIGDEALLDAGGHVLNYEAGGIAAISGVIPRSISSERGVVTAQTIESHLRAVNDHHAPVRLVILENTHNMAGGTIFPLTEQKRIRELTRSRGIAVHVDGARIFNASVATGVSIAEYASCCDTLAFCFSKGLGAPVGSMIAGSSETIALARRMRKMLGGGMRQAGLLAAAAIYALDHNIEGLADDHRRARDLASSIEACDNFSLYDGAPETNILFMRVDTPGGAQPVVDKLAQLGVLALATQMNRIRFVTHLDINDDQIAKAKEMLVQVDREIAGRRG